MTEAEGSPPASLPFKGQVTEQVTVKRSVRSVIILVINKSDSRFAVSDWMIINNNWTRFL